MRPQLTADEAADRTPARVLGWRPPDGLPVRDADYHLASLPADGAFGSLQAAIDKAIRDAGRLGRTERIVIELTPGRHVGPAILPRLRIEGREVPVTIRGGSADSTELSAAIDARMPGREYRARFGHLFADSPPEVRAVFDRIAQAESVGTGQSAVLRIEGDDVELAGLTIRNAYNCDRTGAEPPEPGAVRNAHGQWSDETHQAVALHLDGAVRAQCERLVLRSFQDTLFLNQEAEREIEGALFRDCRIEGDVDFIFGPATAFFSGCEVRSLGIRSPNSWAVAPSTPLRRPQGFVFDGCAFSHDGSPTALAGRFKLGRQWFQGVRATPYGMPDVPGYTCRLGSTCTYDPPVGTISAETLHSIGKCVILNSRIGAHIDPVSPWDAWKGREYRPDGTTTELWTPRYRPAQYRGADLLENLAGWPDRAALRLADVDPAAIFLGEFDTGGADP